MIASVSLARNNKPSEKSLAWFPSGSAARHPAPACGVPNVRFGPLERDGRAYGEYGFGAGVRRQCRVPEHLDVRRDMHPFEDCRLVKDLADPLAVAHADCSDRLVIGLIPAGRNTELVGAVSADRIIPDRAACIRGADRNIWSRRVVDT